MQILKCANLKLICISSKFSIDYSHCLEFRRTKDFCGEEYLISEIVLNCQCMMIIRTGLSFSLLVHIFVFSPDIPSPYFLSLEQTAPTALLLRCYWSVLSYCCFDSLLIVTWWTRIIPSAWVEPEPCLGFSRLPVLPVSSTVFPSNFHSPSPAASAISPNPHCQKKRQKVVRLLCFSFIIFQNLNSRNSYWWVNLVCIFQSCLWWCDLIFTDEHQWCTARGQNAFPNKLVH